MLRAMQESEWPKKKCRRMDQFYGIFEKSMAFLKNLRHFFWVWEQYSPGLFLG